MSENIRDTDKAILRKAIDMAVKSNRSMTDMQEDIRSFLRNAAVPERMTGTPSKDRAEAHRTDASDLLHYVDAMPSDGNIEAVASALNKAFAEGMKRAAEWRTDIENAPKDYTPVLLYDPSYDPYYAFEAFFDADVDMGGSATWVHPGGSKDCKPTHWMPFPECPEGGGK